MSNNTMEITIIRLARYGKALHGRLRIGGEHVCDTLEHVDRRLPPGEYYAHLERVESMHRKMVVLRHERLSFSLPSADVEDCATPPMLMATNGPYALHGGSIGIGEWRYLGFLVRCQEFMEPLFERVRMALSRHHTVKVVVREDGDLFLGE